MNTCFKFLPLAAAFLFLAGCSSSNEKISSSATPTASEVPANLPVINKITGVVTEIRPGKDGYTAKVKTTRLGNVFVTVSRVNLKAPETYRTVNIGDTIQVMGEEWQMNEETHLKALELK